jgi:hypothetical protein
MAVAAPNPPNPLTYQTQRAIVLRAADADVTKILKDLQSDVIRMLREVQSRPAGIGRDIREAQLRLVQRNLSAQLSAAWRRIGDVTAARRVEAAARAAALQEDINRYTMLLGGVPDGEAIAQAIYDSEVANAASGLDRMIARTSGASYVPLQERVYNSEVGVGSKVDRLVNSALARGLSAVEFAREVREFVNPLTPGGASYAAKRLARTEINNAAHAMAIESVRETPWVGSMRWTLSGSHGRPDVCDQYAHGGPNNDGVYPKTAVPVKPHPQCLCYPVSVIIDDDEFENSLLAGHYNRYLEKYRNLQPGQVVTTSFGGFGPPPAPKPRVVKPTKTAQAPKKAAKPPSQAKPPTPGATAARTTPAPRPVDPAMEIRIRQLSSQGATLAKTRNAIAQEFNISKEEAEALVRQVTSTAPASLVSRQATLTAPRPTPAPVATAPPRVTAAPKAARVTTSAEDASKSWVPDALPEHNVLPDLARKLPPDVQRHIEDLTRRLGGDEKLLIQRELQHQGSLVPGTLKRLDAVRFEVDAQIRGQAVNGYYHHPVDFVNRTKKDEIVLSDRLFKPGYGREQLQSEITGFKSSCGAEHAGAQSVLAHEFGHHVDWIMRQSIMDYSTIDGLWKEIADTLGVDHPITSGHEDLEAWFAKHQDVISTKVSRYAATNRNEFFAEIWREYSGNPKARPQIKRIGQKIHGIMGELVK